ncbi:MAG: hypothetical protein AB7S65_12250 [Sulfuricurvum sp.]
MYALPIKRFLKRVISKIELQKWKIQEGIYLSEKKTPKKVLFYFNDPKRFHFGDHLFFAPLVKLFIANDIETHIAPLKPMAFYFKQMGGIIVDTPDLDTYDIICTWIGFYDLFKGRNKPLLIIDTTDIRINRPLCSYFVDHVSELYGFSKKERSDRAFIPQTVYPDHLIDRTEQYLIFNPYFDSSPFHIRKRHYQMLASTAEHLARKKNLKVILTGTESEKMSDPDSYPFVDLDLRGKTSIEDLFALAAAGNVLINVSFDAFGMHLFFIHDKPSYIIFRGRFLEKNTRYIIDFVNPPFEVDRATKNRLVTYLQ